MYNPNNDRTHQGLYNWNGTNQIHQEDDCLQSQQCLLPPLHPHLPKSHYGVITNLTALLLGRLRLLGSLRTIRKGAFVERHMIHFLHHWL